MCWGWRPPKRERRGWNDRLKQVQKEVCGDGGAAITAEQICWLVLLGVHAGLSF